MHPLKQSALVTGGAGFIGSHLCEALVRQGADVTVVDDLSTGDVSNLHAVADEIDFRQLDMLSSEFLDLVAGGQFDVIFHLAGNSYVPPSVKWPDRDFALNLQAPFQILEALRCNAPNTRLITASTASVYGNPAVVPVPETAPTVPIAPYGVSKLAAERYVLVYSLLYGIKAASLRFFSVFGPRQKKQLVYDFFQKLHRDPARLEIIGDGTQIRDLVYVTDVVQALLLVNDHAPLIGEVYNVGTGKGNSTLEVGEAVARAAGLEPTITFTGEVRPGDCEKWIADISRLESLGFTPRVGLQEGVERICHWYHDLLEGMTA